MSAAVLSVPLSQHVGPGVAYRRHPAPAAAAAATTQLPLRGAAGPIARSPSHHRRRWQLHAAADNPPGSSSSSGSGSGAPGGSGILGSGLSGAAPPGFLQNPAIAQREALRLFFSATTVEAQQRVLDEAAALVDLGTRCGSMLCGTAASNIVPFTRRRWGPGQGCGESPGTDQPSPLRPPPIPARRAIPWPTLAPLPTEMAIVAHC